MSTDAGTGTDDPTSANLLALLEADHRRIEQLLEEGAMGEDLAREVATHLSAETQLLYREMRNEVPDDDLVDRCLDVDHRVEEAAAQAEEGDGVARQQLISAFADHVSIQEGEAFGRLRAVVPEDRLVVLGDALQQVVRMAPRHPHPHGAEEGPANVVTEAVAGAVDQIEDFVERLFRR